jgi:hypothetical protein
MIRGADQRERNVGEDRRNKANKKYGVGRSRFLLNAAKYQTIRRHILEDTNLCSNLREDPIFHITMEVFNL